MGSRCISSQKAIQVPIHIPSKLFINQNSQINFIQLSSPKDGKTMECKIGSLIGEGAYAKVYECLNTTTGQILALKRYSLSKNQYKNQNSLRAILIEMSMLQQLQHPNIVKYYQANFSPDKRHIDVILQCIPSGSLTSLLKKYQCLSQDVIKNYTRQLIGGLTYLHKQGVIHRDLKAANVLITPNGEIKLSDFGCSKEFKDPEFCVSKSLIGSPFWMAPQVARREGHSFPADIWSFGCLLIELSSGRPPWSDVARDQRNVIQCIQTPGQYPRVPVCSQELKELIGACIQREPMNRPKASDLKNYEFYRQ